MSEAIELMESGPEESPDYLDKTKPPATKKPNKLGLIILCGGGLLLLLIPLYTMQDKLLASMWETEQAAAELPRAIKAAVPPIKKPAGPDVEFPATASNTVYVQGQPMVAPAQEPEWVKRQREAQAQAYQAALASGIEMNIVPRNPSQQHTGRIPPPPMPTVNGTIPPPPPAYGGEGAEPPVDPAQQAQERAFLAALDPNASPYLKHAKNPPISPFEIKAGSVIPGVMISGANSELPGQITGQVKQDVYDSATGQHLLIPAGSRLVGTYDSAINGGQSRIFVAWNRIVFPDSSSLTLDSMPGADQAGLAGFKDQVDNHYIRTFGQAFLLSLFSAGIQLSQPRGAVQGTYNAQQIGAAAIGQQLGQLGMQIARRNLYMQPTLEIRPGFEFTIAVNKDMVLPPWQGHPMARGS
jgi:type IV secretion system protein VirB10